METKSNNLQVEGEEIKISCHACEAEMAFSTTVLGLGLWQLRTRAVCLRCGEPMFDWDELAWSIS